MQELERRSPLHANAPVGAAHVARTGEAEMVEDIPDSLLSVVEVRDNGIGIAAHMLSGIFDLFVQADNSVARSQGGLGIGLTLVRSLVEMHGGAVEARSPGLGPGSTFVVKLPLVRVQARREAGATRSSDTRTDPAAARQRVLVVDDNVDSAETLALLLQMGGHEVTVAHDGFTALQAARESRPDVAFLDLGMPMMDGYELASRWRQLPELGGTLLVALTGWGQEEDRRRSSEAGFDVHLIKPVEPSALDRVMAHPRLRRGPG